MPDWKTCEVIEMTAGGDVRLRIGPSIQTARLQGLGGTPDSLAAINALLQRLRQQEVPVRCGMHADSGSGHQAVRVEYLAWRDKTGDVWKDLAGTLVEEGLAVRTADDPSPGDTLN